MTRKLVPTPRTGSDDVVEDIAPVRRVVVGVDGSVACVRALMWALEFADTCDAAVEVVTAWPMHAPVFIGEVPGHFNDARWQAVKAQQMAVEHAGQLLARSVQRVVVRLDNARPFDALLGAAVDATMVVLGTRRPFPTAEGGSEGLAEALQLASGCPVLEVSALGVVSPAGRADTAQLSRSMV